MKTIAIVAIGLVVSGCKSDMKVKDNEITAYTPIYVSTTAHYIFINGKWRIKP